MVTVASANFLPEYRGWISKSQGAIICCAKQRASIKWLLSKAFNNKVPENLREPFYRDHENQEHLKPQIIGALANAEIYCLALGNIYSDPNYHNLNHTAILQTLARKGINISEPCDAQLTETTLIQTNPLRLGAHMAVIESIMVLYAKEVLTPDRVIAAIQRFTLGRSAVPAVPESHEQVILLWVQQACDALKKRIDQELESGVSNGGEGDRLRAPNLPVVKELKDLCDGVALAALVSFYCPDELPWTSLRISYLPTVQESLHNLGLVKDFCERCLSSSIFHVMPEDVTYMRGSMRQNLVVFLADLFNVLEINPAKCVRYPGMDKSSTVTKSTPTHMPVRKANSFMSEMSEDSLRRGSDDSFVVHRGKNIPTLSSVINNKERQNNDTKADERGDTRPQVPAGRPSNWEENRKSTYAGRRSRRNSVSDDSQLTIENFGGSQDNINFIGRNPDKEVGIHVGRKISAPAGPIENPAVRSSIQDARGTLQIGYDNGCEKMDNDNNKIKRQLSSDDILKSQNKENILKDLVDGEVMNRINFADVNKHKGSGIQLIYMQHDKEDLPSKSSFKTNGAGEKKTTTFAALPNTTTWQQQSSQQNTDTTAEEETTPNNSNHTMNTQLNDIRMKLEEKRRHIENEKRRMEMAMNKQRQKVGKAAFLQAVVKDISDDVGSVERKWLEQEQPFVETRRTPDLENMDLEQYQQSIAQMNSSLHDIQSDIQRLASQQSQMQAAQQQSLLAQQQRQLHAMQQQQYFQHQQQLQNMQQQYPAQPFGIYQQPVYNPLQSSASAPHIPQSLYNQQQRAQSEQPQFFLHESSNNSSPAVPQRRTWAQQAQMSVPLQPELRTWGRPQNPGGFLLHEGADQSPQRYQNGERSLGGGFTLSQQHAQQQQLFGSSQHSTPSASPQHHGVHRQISQLMDDSKRSPVSLQQMEPVRKSSVTHAPIPAPPADDMEPQNISFIGSQDKQLSDGLSRLNITSGSRTYRIPSPTRPAISRTSFQPSLSPEPSDVHPRAEVSSLDNDPTSQKGFYISFDNEQPKRPKPPLRMKKNSPRKERSCDVVEEDNTDILGRKKQLEKELDEERLKTEEEERRKKERIERERLREREKETSQERQKVAAASAIIIGNDLSNPDPDLIDEREKKKERIMMLSLQRRQQQEEAKIRKQQEMQAIKEREKEKEEERQRRKEEQNARRAAILEQHRMKKAIEEAEKEGKTIDKMDLMSSLKPTPKLRTKGSTSRPRPKTIHIDSSSVEMAEGMLQPARGKKGSNSNLTVNSNYHTGSTMKRDYYRGSQDSLADRGIGGGLIYKGSSTDQDSLAYRYGDTDSGLGRATPPRRAPSPGMGPMRHLPSPSGPGSLPGFMSKRRTFDDGSSDISSTPSSMMDYTGPRLYKQPTTKSNRSIMLNAVEYCVFPGAVNREAKRRVLEEIARSESKHFLILFRDAGCQFRALYSYCPDREEVTKLYGTGPKQVNDRMFDKFFKYNSGGKCFSQIHTKHLTVTIDAFTIHNSLWQGKKVNLPSKKDMALVI